MKDILGREVKDNDLIIGMTISKYSDGMRFGVWNKNKVFWENGIKSTVNNIYLVENPCDKELEIKNKILEKIKITKNLDGKISANDYKVGHVYETVGGLKFVYLGRGNLNIKINEVEYLKEGFIYYNCSGYGIPLKSATYHENKYLDSQFICLKVKKKFVKDTGRKVEILDNPCVIESRWVDYFNRNFITRVEFTLFDI